MNFALSDEQELLREAARGTLSRLGTVAAARETLDGAEPPDLWPAACEAGWPGLVIAEEQGGAGLGALDAMLVAAECGRVLAPAPLLGHVPATAVLESAGADGELLAALASGERRAALAGAQPPGDLDASWTTDPLQGKSRAAAPTLGSDGALNGSVAWVPDAPGADVLVVAALREDGTPAAVVVEGGQAEVEARRLYDATRSLGHVRLDGARGTVLEGDAADALAYGWNLGQALLAAEALGAVEAALEVSVAYAKERFTFGRPIGSYQAIKHALVEVLRRQENLRSLIYYAGWAGQAAPAEFALAANAARFAAGEALDFASREMISVHGGIGATWEHDAPLYFRRAQLSRRLLGGDGAAADRVAGEVMGAPSLAAL